MLALYRPKASQFTGCFNKKKGVVQDRPASLRIFMDQNYRRRNFGAALFNVVLKGVKSLDGVEGGSFDLPPGQDKPTENFSLHCPPN